MDVGAGYKVMTTFMTSMTWEIGKGMVGTNIVMFMFCL